jgi:glutamine synthetase
MGDGIMNMMPNNARDALKLLREKDIRFLDLKFLDLFGSLQHLTIPVEVVDEGTFQDGLGLDGSSIRGFKDINESDMIMKPDPTSAFIDPFFDDPAVSVFCDIIDPDGYKPYEKDGRNVARRAENLIRSLGIADKAYFGPELEFFVFDDVRYDQATQHGFYFINVESAFWTTGQEKGDKPSLGHIAPRKQAYFAVPPVDFYQNLRSKMSTLLRQVGVEVELHHHEVAAAGQNEIGIRFGSLLRQADCAVKFKYIVKNTAHRYDKTVTFMPKPLFEENGSGMHVHVSLWKDNKNLFYQPGGYADLSQLALKFIGGLLHHAPALCAFCSPTTNSYRRLVPGYEAPINLVYSQGNRSACIRVPFSGDNPKAKRIEFRSPDPSCNPYLAFAAILLAGIDGIQNSIEPPPPVDENVYKLVGAERGRGIKNTPGSLDKALDALEQDSDFLTRYDVFTPELIDTWIRTKRESEIKYISLRPHPGEFNLYFDV